MIGFINGVNAHYSSQKIPILFDITATEPIDKLSINLLELIAYHLLVNLGQKIVFVYSFTKTIVTDQMENSAFTYLGLSNYSKSQFVERFLDFHKGPNYREFYQSKGGEDLGKLLSRIQLDYMVFCQMHGIGSSTARHIGKLISELVDNSIIHANSSALVDLDIAKNFSNSQTGMKVTGVNVTVLNISSTLFFEGVKEKLKIFDNNIDTYKSSRLFETYNNISVAYKFHKKYFSQKYTENHFWEIASLQHHISGRENRFNTNGVGMTKLIKLIQEFSDNDYSYIASGTAGIWFRQHLMRTVDSEHQMLGFNTDNNFFKNIPDDNTLGYSKLFIPGTFLNLSFAIKNNEE
ncbi:MULTISPECIES: hypothetical protein [Leuconostoc]|uniref:hypothetical protein n=1 Tax=Leuconostoc TaxID=1243 RepID=UPI001CC42D3C|nr:MULTISPECIES: hypothetical protein [Leuconostoc]MBZ5983272.1 hypothetical protein [Leuconostoc gasicomitatum]MDP0486835.1 hypothetical protein [Leuconostoc mesenteroides]